MYRQSGISQEWSVHAQLTVSHRRPTDGVILDMAPPPNAGSAVPCPQHDSGGVHMQYAWGDQPTSPQLPSMNVPPRTSYGFQRGNILFTTCPPREPQSTTTLTQHLRDSGYGSEQPSPGSYASLPVRRPSQPYDRRCKSTCSIILSGAEGQGVASTSMGSNVNTDMAQCSDPVCFHRQQTSPLQTHQQVRPTSSYFAPFPDVCEVCGGGRSPTAVRRATAANTFTTHFCTRVPDRLSRDIDRPNRDVASQTSDHMISTTAPDFKVASACRSKPTQPKMGNKVIYGGERRKTDSELLQLPVINVPEPEIEPVKVSLYMVPLKFLKCRMYTWIISLETYPMLEAGYSLSFSFCRAFNRSD
jgi:hypothetical protein